MIDITWAERRGQIKHLLYELCLTGRIDKATFCEQLQDLNKVEPVVRCKDCKYCITHGKILFCEYMGNIGDWRFRTETDYCSRGESRDGK